MRLDESAGYDLLLIDSMTWIKSGLRSLEPSDVFHISYFIGHANIDVYRALLMLGRHSRVHYGY